MHLDSPSVKAVALRHVLQLASHTASPMIGPSRLTLANSAAFVFDLKGEGVGNCLWLARQQWAGREGAGGRTPTQCQRLKIRGAPPLCLHAADTGRGCRSGNMATSSLSAYPPLPRQLVSCPPCCRHFYSWA